MECKIYQWGKEYGPPAYTVIDNKIYHGYVNGSPTYEIRGNQIFRYHSNGSPIFTIMGDDIYPGRFTAGVPQFAMSETYFL